jgi:hypothetical protein
VSTQVDSVSTFSFLCMAMRGADARGTATDVR